MIDLAAIVGGFVIGAALAYCLVKFIIILSEMQR